MQGGITESSSVFLPMMKFHTDFQALHGGRFISRGRGRHVTRTIDNWELILIISGTLDMFEGDVQYHPTAGKAFLLQPNMLHGGLTDYAPGLSFYWIHFLPRNRAALHWLKSRPKVQAVSSWLADALQNYLSREAIEPQNQVARDLLLELALQELDRPTPPPGQPLSVPFSPYVREALEIIKREFSSPLSSRGLARRLGCSPDYLERLFQRHLHHSITQEIQFQRTELVRAMLINTTLSVKEIAAQAGFCDAIQCRRIFRRRFSARPSEYRRMHQPGHRNTM